MPTYVNPKSVTVVPRGGDSLVRVLACLAVLAAVAGGIYWLLADTIFLTVALTVLSALSLGGSVLAARYVTRDRGRLWHGERSESAIMLALQWRPARRVRAVPLRALPAAVPPLAIEAPKRVLTGVVVERELARVTSEQEG